MKRFFTRVILAWHHVQVLKSAGFYNQPVFEHFAFWTLLRVLVYHSHWQLRRRKKYYAAEDRPLYEKELQHKLSVIKTILPPVKKKLFHGPRFKTNREARRVLMLVCMETQAYLRGSLSLHNWIVTLTEDYFKHNHFIDWLECCGLDNSQSHELVELPMWIYRWLRCDRTTNELWLG